MPALGSSEHVRSRHSIDRLPDLIRKAVIDAIVRGDPLRDIAKLAGCSFKNVALYRDRHIMPSLNLTPLCDPMESITCESDQNQPKHTNNTTQQNQQLSRVTSQPTQPTQSNTRAILAASPVRRRTENLFRFTTKQLIKATKAVRVKTDKAGTEYIDGRDFGPLAPLINQAHKNIELQGRLSGELASQAGTTNVAVQIVLPAAATPAAPEAIDVDFDVLKR